MMNQHNPFAKENLEQHSEQHSEQYNQSSPYYPPTMRKKKNIWPWIAGAAAVLAIIVISILTSGQNNRQMEMVAAEGEQVAVLYVEGTLSLNSDASDNYNHQYILDTVDRLMNDPQNVGLLLYLDSPGGELIAGDELARKFSEYQQKTGRPLYAYGHSMLASGAYWAACSADKVILNRYCLTGSIGVTYGTLLDFSGLLEKYGVKATHIDSGKNKGMGDMLVGMTAEQVAILQTLIDEYYQCFVDVVAAGRGLAQTTVRTLADGRVYSATQAVDNGLADQVAYYEEALAEFRIVCGVSEEAVCKYRYEPATDLWSLLGTENRLGSVPGELMGVLETVQPVAGFLTYYEGFGNNNPS